MEPRTDHDPSLLKLLADAIPVAIFLADVAGRVSGWTGSAEKLLGLSESDAIGLRYDALFEPMDEANVPDLLIMELAGHVASYREIGRAIRADGSRFLAIFTMDRVRDDRGTTSGYACTLAPV